MAISAICNLCTTDSILENLAARMTEVLIKCHSSILSNDFVMVHWFNWFNQLSQMVIPFFLYIFTKTMKKKYIRETRTVCCLTLIIYVSNFLHKIGKYMHYFLRFVYTEGSWEISYKFSIVSVVAGLVESHPISTKLDDDLTVPLSSAVVGSCKF
ncbi:unnamed protein product [Coffea canephora]|uniref:Uncharacterized protein n=1 Tax=Coffea canephora TaxID=49390 RepID=A0A068V0F7_COFCA|nr:unnamed protein product [Coffea canephora]